ncbi:hypothetical protein LCGC14_2490700 [marine sediment metagenome]|uniref:Uncharacterized protein n=1 Tax=marine sediment metagenome TaxID=412755 RepID=A0A0F9DYL3_9ZZZZ
MLMIAFLIAYVVIVALFMYLNYYIIEGTPEVLRVFTVFVAAALWPCMGGLTAYCTWKYGLNK